MFLDKNTINFSLLAKKSFFLLKIAPVFLSVGVIFLFIIYYPQSIVKAKTLSTMVNVVEVICGDNVAQSWESCDGSDLRGKSCTAFGYSGGTLQCTNVCTYDLSGCVSNNNSGGSSVSSGVSNGSSSAVLYVRETRVILKGTAYPYSKVFLLKNGVEIKNLVADADGGFNFNIKLDSGGIYSFGLLASDLYGNKSKIVNINADISSQKTTIIDGVLIPPTVYSNKRNAIINSEITLFGQSSNGSIVNIYVNNMFIGSADAKTNGGWKLVLTYNKSFGNNAYIYTISKTDNKYSERSLPISISLSKKNEFSDIISNMRSTVDINGDKKVDVADLSILIYWFNKKTPPISESKYVVDFNHDGVVDFADLSILLFYWTG